MALASKRGFYEWKFRALLDDYAYLLESGKVREVADPVSEAESAREKLVAFVDALIREVDSGTTSERLQDMRREFEEKYGAEER